MTERKWRARLGDDGELPELIEHEAGEPLYCTQCGALNPSNARFCHKCGYSLEEQAADVIGLSALVRTERKKVQPAERRHNALASALLQIISMASLTVLGGAAIMMNQGAALIPIVLAWFLTEAVRSGKDITVARALVGIFTTLLVSSLGVMVILTGQSGAIILLMLVWFLIEAVRANA